MPWHRRLWLSRGGGRENLTLGSFTLGTAVSWYCGSTTRSKPSSLVGAHSSSSEETEPRYILASVASLQTTSMGLWDVKGQNTRQPCGIRQGVGQTDFLGEEILGRPLG